MKKIISVCVCFIMLMVSGCFFHKEQTVGEKLAVAIENGNYQAVKECLQEKSLDLEHLGISQNTNFKKKDERALAFALESSADNQTAIINLLLDAGADAASKSDDQSYLQVAEEMDFNLLERFIKGGADINEEVGGYRLLDAVVENLTIGNEQQEEKMIDYLLGEGAQIDKTTLKFLMKGEWRYSFAKKVLKQIKAEKKPTGISKALEAAILGNDQLLKNQIKNKDILEKEQTDIVFFSAANCKKSTIKQLFKSGYSFKRTDIGGRTPLHIAALYNTSDVVQYLENQGISGAPIYENDEDMAEENYSALDFAILSGDYDKYKICKKAGIRDDKDFNLWDMAVRFGNEKTMELLDRIGFEPSLSEIADAYTLANDKMISCLIKNGYKVSTITDSIVSSCSVDVVKQLYRQNADVSQEALCRMIEAEENEIAKTVLNEERYQGKLEKEILLYHAVESGNLDMVKFFVEHGADVNRLTEEGDGRQSAFHEAAANLSFDIFEYLKEHGGDLKKKDSEGRTVVEIAKEAGNSKYVEK